MIPHTFAERAVRTHEFGRVLEVDTKKARYFNIPWHSLGSFGKRKFENLLVLSKTGDLAKIIYKI